MSGLFELLVEVSNCFMLFIPIIFGWPSFFIRRPARPLTFQATRLSFSNVDTAIGVVDDDEDDDAAADDDDDDDD